MSKFSKNQGTGYKERVKGVGLPSTVQRVTLQPANLAGLCDVDGCYPDASDEAAGMIRLSLNPARSRKLTSFSVMNTRESFTSPRSHYRRKYESAFGSTTLLPKASSP